MSVDPNLETKQTSRLFVYKTDLKSVCVILETKQTS